MRRQYDVSIDGVSMLDAYGLVLTDDTDLGVAEPKTYTVDIPGGNGSIDLTTALTGDVAFDTRTMKLVFATDDVGDVAALRRRLTSAVHGRRLPFTLGFEPEYTYTGRFSVEVTPLGICGAEVKLTVDADPYKLKERCVYRLNATGGKLFRLESGRRPVHPTIECEGVCWVTFGGETVAVPAGTHVLRDVVFREGINEIYVNSRRIWAETWADVGEGGADEAAWADAAALTWDGIQRLGLADAEGVPQSWAEVALDTWAGLGAKTWRDLDYRRTEAAQGSADVYLTYDWEDL